MDEGKQAFYRALGRALKNARERRPGGGLTQQEVAVALGVTQATISDYESGRRRINAYDLGRVCELLDLGPEEALYPGRPPQGLASAAPSDKRGESLVAEPSPLPMTWPSGVRVVELDAPADVHLYLSPGDVLLVSDAATGNERAPSKVVGALRRSAAETAGGPK